MKCRMTCCRNTLSRRTSFKKCCEKAPPPPPPPPPPRPPPPPPPPGRPPPPPGCDTGGRSSASHGPRSWSHVALVGLPLVKRPAVENLAKYFRLIGRIVIRFDRSVRPRRLGLALGRNHPGPLVRFRMGRIRRDAARRSRRRWDGRMRLARGCGHFADPGRTAELCLAGSGFVVEVEMMPSESKLHAGFAQFSTLDLRDGSVSPGPRTTH